MLSSGKWGCCPIFLCLPCTHGLRYLIWFVPSFSFRFAFAKMLFELQLRNGSNFLLFWFGVVKGGDLVSAGWLLQQYFEGFCILRLCWDLELGYIFSSFLAIEGPCIAITNNMCPLGQGFNSLAWCCFRFKALLNKSLSLHVASPIF